MKRYVVRLEAEERSRLEEVVRKGKSGALRIRHANVLLAVDESDVGANLTDASSAAAFGVSVRSIESLRKRFVEEGVEACLVRKKQEKPSIAPMFDGENEARLIAIACGPKPDGCVRWTLELLAERAVALHIVERCSRQTVLRTLKKTS